ncbi:MAG: hypothetical protein Q6L60_07910 [Thermostichus sp. HHBFW_bins_43]
MAARNGRSSTLPEQEASGSVNGLNLAPRPADSESAPAASESGALAKPLNRPIFVGDVKISEIGPDNRPVGASTLKVVEYYGDRPVTASSLKVVETWGEGRPTVASSTRFITDPVSNRPVMVDGLKIAKTFMGNRPIEASPLKVLN